jgi:hypothetical protein
LQHLGNVRILHVRLIKSQSFVYELDVAEEFGAWLDAALLTNLDI